MITIPIIGLFTLWCLQGSAPCYQSDNIIGVADVASWKRLRSSSANSLIVWQSALDIVGERLFPYAGANLWNGVPDELTVSGINSGRFYFVLSWSPLLDVIITVTVININSEVDGGNRETSRQVKQQYSILTKDIGKTQNVIQFVMAPIYTFQLTGCVNVSNKQV